MQAIRTTLLAAAVASLFAACADVRAQAAASAADETLYYRFELPAKLQWGTVSVSLSPAGWRVGKVAGPPASAAQMRAVLGRLTGVEIGGRCAGWVDGTTGYPCGFAVTHASGFTAIRFDEEISPEARKARLPGTDTPAFRASGLMAPVLDQPRFVGVRVPAALIGNAGTSFQFRIRALSNALVPSVFDRASGGTLILRGGGTGELDGAAALAPARS